MFKLKQDKFVDAYWAYQDLKDTLVKQKDNQLAIDDSKLKDWTGEAADTYKKNRPIFFDGKYTNAIDNTQSMIELCEASIPTMNALMNRLECIGEQLDSDYEIDEYAAVEGDFSKCEKNDGYLAYDNTYASVVYEDCLEILTKAKKGKDLLHNLMDDCGSVVDFGDLSDQVDTSCKKLCRIKKCHG